MSKKKLLVGLVAVALMLWVGVPQASAQTIEELQAQIQALLAQLQQLQGGGATACTFTRDLTVGSSGADVTCLQNYLISTGHYTFAGGATGYFGEITKAAVAAWQSANGLPSTGYFGPLSRAKYTSLAGTVTPPAGGPCTGGALYHSETGAPCGTQLPAGCTSTTGYSTTTGLPCGVTLPAGCTSTTGYSSTTGLPCGTTTGVGDGKRVAVTASLKSTPSDGTDVRVGDAKIKIAKWEIVATNDSGTLVQATMEATNRMWLYVKAMRLLDGSDNVIAEKASLGSSDFSEVTVGSLYQLVFANLNVPMPQDQKVYLVLEVDAVNDTSRSAASGLVIRHPSTGLVVLDEDDDYSVSTGVTSNRTWDFLAAATGNAVPSLNAGSLASRFIKVSESGTTPKVTALVFDIKAEQRDIELNTIRLGASSSEDTLANLFSSVDLYEGSCPTDGDTTGCTSLAGGEAAAGGTDGSALAGRQYTFSNLNVTVPKDTKKSFTVKATLADEDDYTVESATSSAASTTISATVGTLAGVDKPNYNTITVSGSAITGGDIHSILVAPALSNTSGSANRDNTIEYKANLTFKFTLKADGGAIYVSKTPAVALATSSDLSASTTQSVSNYGARVTAVSAESSACDTATYYCIGDGSSKTFTFTGVMDNQNNTSGLKNFKILGIYFDDDITGLTEYRIPGTFAAMSAFDVYASLDVADRN